jgi:hypothetical protein
MDGRYARHLHPSGPFPREGTYFEIGIGPGPKGLIRECTSQNRRIVAGALEVFECGVGHTDQPLRTDDPDSSRRRAVADLHTTMDGSTCADPMRAAAARCPFSRLGCVGAQH